MTQRSPSISLGKFLPYTVIILFAGWCAVAFRADLAQISFAPIWAAKDAVLLAGGLSLLNYAVRIARWHVYVTRLGTRAPLKFTTLAYIAGFAFTLSPGKLGELVRAHYFKQTGLPISAAAAAFVVERLLDLLAVVTIALLAFGATSGYKSLLWTSVLAVGLVLGGLASVPWSKSLGALNRWTGLPVSADRWLTGLVRGLSSAKTLLQPGVLISGFALGLCAWGAEGVGLGVLGALAPSVTISWPDATGIYAVSIIVGAVSMLPGGLGSTEVVMATLLSAHGYRLSDALLLTLVCRALTLWLAVVLGWLAVLLLRFYPGAAGGHRA